MDKMYEFRRFSRSTKYRVNWLTQSPSIGEKQDGLFPIIEDFAKTVI